MPVATIVDLDVLQVQALMSPEQAAQVKAGMPAEVAVKEFPGQRFEGRVSAITTEPGRLLLGGPRYVALADFQNRHGLVKPGMKPALLVKIGEAKNVPAVPANAVEKDRTGRPVVKVLRQGQWQSVVVEIRLSDGRFTEIRSGLQEGETVQVKPGIL